MRQRKVRPLSRRLRAKNFLSNGSADLAAEQALQARQRIERAVDQGRLPTWVLDACEAWEQAALAYGAAMARDERSSTAQQVGTGSIRVVESRRLH